MILEAHNLRFSYRGDGQETPVLHGVSLHLRRGEFVALTGRSGCGKSTLLYLLGLMLKPDGGWVTVDGQPTLYFDDADRTRLRRRKIGFVFQRFNLIPVLSAADNIRLAMRVRHVHDEGQARRLLEEVGLADVADKLPGQMSVGQQQRVAIARALAGAPAVLLADEPTGNLDSQTAQEVLALLRRCNRQFGQTILMVTHDPAVAAAADRVLRMADGRLVDADGTPLPPEKDVPMAEPVDELTEHARRVAQRVDVRRWFHFFQLFLMACLLGVVAFSFQFPGRPEWLTAVSLCIGYLAYMSMACTFLPLPTTMLILFLASGSTGPVINPWPIAILGAIGTMIANLNDYHIVSGLLRLRKVQKVRHNALVKDAIKLFAKAPFLTLTVFAFVPIPVDAVRLISIGHGYSRVRYAAAYLLGRFPRYLLLAWLGKQWAPKWWEILIVGGVLGLLALWKLWRDHAAGKRERRARPAAIPDAVSVKPQKGVGR
jgi:ABC-type lipoprotein export system ATPase subunit/membrane protein YqaA with SNARE-associated domain